jgi:hypothetical protein
MSAGLGDSINQAGDQGHKRRQQPQAPPRRASGALHHLMTAESTEAIERTGHASAVATQMQLQAAVRASRIVFAVQDHRRLIAAGTKTGRDERQRRKLQLKSP